MSIFTCLCIALATTIIYPLARIYTHYRPLRDSPVPVLIVAISLPRSVRGIFSLLDANTRLAIFFSLARFQTHSWNFRDKFALHARYGKSFFLVTPWGREFVTADWPVAERILTRRKSFAKPLGLLDKLELFGPHLASVEDTTWQRHRRITTNAFNAHTDQTAWHESLARAAHLSAIWTRHETTITSTFPDLANISLDVLFRACLPVAAPQAPGFSTQECKTSLLRFLESLTVPSRWVLPYPLGRRRANPLRTSARDLGANIARLVAHRRRSPLESTLGGDLLSTLLKCEDKSRTGRRDWLAADEIQGNLFLFLFAGHETTANTLLYAVYLLAIFPTWQVWVGEKIDALLGDGEPGFEVFGRAIRLRAVMMETLRLYGPVVNVLRETRGREEIVQRGETAVVVPAHTAIRVNSVALHTDPDTWGEDALEWRPARWVLAPRGGAGAVHDEVFDAQMERHLLAWSEGPRVCPGKRFAQIEILAVLLQLLRRHRVEIVPDAGETVAQAQKRAWQRVQMSSMSLTLHIPQPERVRLRWVRR
ncbi:cytochrome P450, partial [Aspergillus homomorphus CBS 101889]